MGEPVTITPDQAPSAGPVTITPDSQPQRGGIAGAWDKFKSTVQGPIEIPGLPNISRQANEVKDLATGAVKSASEVSAPAIAGEIYKKFTGQPNTLKELPGKMVTQGVPLMLGEPEADAEGAARPAPRAAEPTGDLSQPGMISRALDVAKRRVGHIPGVQAVKDLNYVVRGSGEAPAPPAPPTPSVPDSWGKGQYGTPIDQWGQKIPQQSAPAMPKSGGIAEAMRQPPTPAPLPFESGKLGSLLNESLGASPDLKPNVPLKEQMPAYGPPKTDFNGKVPNESLGFDFSPAKDYGNAARADVEQKMGPLPRGKIAEQMKSAPSEDLTPVLQESVDKATEVPEGHTSVESRALKSYKYDPAAREFHAQYNSNPGKIHIFGDVSPEEAQAFQDADSKGTAMQSLRRNPEVARIVNGKRIAVKPLAKQ